MQGLQQCRRLLFELRGGALLGNAGGERLCLREQRVVSFATMMAALEVSRATLKRDLEYMRSRLHAPIAFDRDAGGYRLLTGSAESRYALPGLWFSAAEIHALLTLQHLVANLRGGSILGSHLKAVSARLESALGAADRSTDQLRRRVVEHYDAAEVARQIVSVFEGAVS